MKRKIVTLLFIMSIPLILSSCGISESDYNSVKEKNSALESELEDTIEYCRKNGQKDAAAAPSQNFILFQLST